jgi:hypothetical protein
MTTKDIGTKRTREETEYQVQEGRRAGGDNGKVGNENTMKKEGCMQIGNICRGLNAGFTCQSTTNGKPQDQVF